MKEYSPNEYKVNLHSWGCPTMYFSGFGISYIILRGKHWQLKYYDHVNYDYGVKYFLMGCPLCILVVMDFRHNNLGKTLCAIKKYNDHISYDSVIGYCLTI